MHLTLYHYTYFSEEGRVARALPKPAVRDTLLLSFLYMLACMRGEGDKLGGNTVPMRKQFHNKSK